jgi:CHAD domain-containing protein
MDSVKACCWRMRTMEKAGSIIQRSRSLKGGEGRRHLCQRRSLHTPGRRRSQALDAAYCASAKKFLRWRDEVLSQVDIEAVHEMRVASRRLRATLDAYETACKPGRFKKIYRQTQRAADMLGAARDTDTMIQQGEGWLEQAPFEEQAGRRWLLERLHTLRQRQQQQLQAFMHDLDVQAFKDRAASCIPKGAASDGKS